MEFANTVTIERPVQDVFEFLADFDSVPKLHPAGGGTRLINSAHLQASGLGRQVAPIALGRIQKALAANLEKVEGAHGVLGIDPRCLGCGLVVGVA